MDRKTKEALGTTALAGATAGAFGAAALGANAAGTERRNRRQARERDEQRVQARKEKHLGEETKPERLLQKHA